MWIYDARTHFRLSYYHMFDVSRVKCFGKETTMLSSQRDANRNTFTRIIRIIQICLFKQSDAYTKVFGFWCAPFTKPHMKRLRCKFQSFSIIDNSPHKLDAHEHQRMKVEDYVA